MGRLLTWWHARKRRARTVMNHRGSPSALLLTSNLLIGRDLWPQRSQGRKLWPSGQIYVCLCACDFCGYIHGHKSFWANKQLKWVSLRSRSWPRGLERVGTPVCSWQLVNRGRFDRQPQSPTTPNLSLCSNKVKRRQWGGRCDPSKLVLEPIFHLGTIREHRQCLPHKMRVGVKDKSISVA